MFICFPLRTSVDNCFFLTSALYYFACFLDLDALVFFMSIPYLMPH